MSGILIKYGDELDGVLTFEGKSVRSATITQEISAISTDMPANTFDVQLELDGSQNYPFRNGKPLDVYFNGEFTYRGFVRNFKRNSNKLWRIECEDYIGRMENTPFSGDFFQDTSAVEVLKKVFDTAKVPYTIDDNLSTKTISGELAATTCRDALMQICFAIGAVADTTGRKDVAVFALLDEVTQTLPPERIMIKQGLTDTKKVSEVRITAREFVKETEPKIVFIAPPEYYDRKGVYIKFDEPMADVYVEDNKEATIVESSPYHIVVDFHVWTIACVIKGYPYKINKTVSSKKNPLASDAEADNVVEINDAVLANPKNVDEILNRCYNYLTTTKEVNTKIIDGKHIIDGVVTYDKPTKVGDVVTVPTEFGEPFTGRIVKQSYNLNGGILTKNTTLR